MLNIFSIIFLIKDTTFWLLGFQEWQITSNENMINWETSRWSYLSQSQKYLYGSMAIMDAKPTRTLRVGMHFISWRISYLICKIFIKMYLWPHSRIRLNLVKFIVIYYKIKLSSNFILKTLWSDFCFIK